MEHPSPAQPLLGSNDDAALQRRLNELEREVAALREENRYLRDLYDQSPLGYQSLDENGCFLEVNQSWLDILGYVRAEVIGKDFGAFLHPDWRDHFRQNFPRFKEAGEINGVEFCMIRKDGSSLTVSFNGKIGTDDRGRFLKTHCVFQDISERKRAEEEVRVTLELLSHFVKHSPIYAFIKEVSPRESRTLIASENYREMLGIAAADMVGKTMHELFPEEFATKMTADDWQVVSQGDNLCLDEDFNGRTYTTYKFPILIGKKNLLAGYTIDITERKRVEEALRRRENQLQRILEILPIGLWFADKDGTLLRGNPMGVKIWGAEPKVPISEYGVFKAWRLPSREPVAAEDWALVKTIRDGATIVDELLEIETFNGEKKIILNYSTPVLDDQGTIDGAIVVNLDISERMALEEQLRQAQKMESIGRLAGGIAHDFNNMLGVILGNTELAMDEVPLSESLYDNLQEIFSAANRSREITRQLLAFARRQTIAPKELDLNETVEGLLPFLRRLIGEQVDLAWLPSRQACGVRMDPSQIDQILTNLCVNARDALADVGRIVIETGLATFDRAYCNSHEGCLPGTYVRLAVSDDGCGMDRQELAQIFDPFYTTKEVGKGTGLGLPTVYGIVKQNDGFITVYSEPGQGSVFKVYLPLLETAGHLQAVQTRNVEGAAAGAETVLLVEDEPSILKMAGKLLRGLGYTVLAAGTPGEAMRIAREYPGTIDLLMTDVIMPEMNGRELARNLLSLYPGMKRLFMSGYTANVIAHHGVLDAGVHFLQKPFSTADLAGKLREVLDSDQG